MWLFFKKIDRRRQRKEIMLALDLTIDVPLRLTIITVGFHFKKSREQALKGVIKCNYAFQSSMTKWR